MERARKAAAAVAGFAASDEMRAVDEPMAVLDFSITVSGSSSFLMLMLIVSVSGCEGDEEGVGVCFSNSSARELVWDFCVETSFRWWREAETDISDCVLEIEELSVDVSSLC